MAAVNRWFYRCLGCLEVVALDSPLDMEWSVSKATCSTCNQHFELMGRVKDNRLLSDRIECVCDDRCIHARGPLCVCHCGGQNHGIGMAGYVQRTYDIGAAPRVTMPNTATRAKSLRQWQEYAAQRDAMRAVLHALLDRKQNAGWLPREDFDRMRVLQHCNREIDAARSHAGRMKKLHAVMPPAPPASLPPIETPGTTEPLPPALLSAGRLF